MKAWYDLQTTYTVKVQIMHTIRTEENIGKYKYISTADIFQTIIKI